MTPDFLLASIVLFALVCVGCPTLDLGEAPVPPVSCNPDKAYFRESIWPEFLNAPDSTNCVAEEGCHGSTDGFSVLRLEIAGASEIAVQDRNYEAVRRFVNCGSPDQSPVRTKPLAGVDSHSGDELFAPDSPHDLVFRGWFP